MPSSKPLPPTQLTGHGETETVESALRSGSQQLRRVYGVLPFKHKKTRQTVRGGGGKEGSLRTELSQASTTPKIPRVHSSFSPPASSPPLSSPSPPNISREVGPQSGQGGLGEDEMENDRKYSRNRTLLVRASRGISDTVSKRQARLAYEEEKATKAKKLAELSRNAVMGGNSMLVIGEAPRTKKSVEGFVNRLKQGSSSPEFKKKSGEEEKKVFVILGGYPDLREALLQRGWVENPCSGSGAFDLKWTLYAKDLDFWRLKEGQIVNHFVRNRELTTKAGLTRNLNLAEHFRKTDCFYPRAFDLGDAHEKEDFILEYKMCKAIAILKLFVQAIENINNPKASYFTFGPPLVETALAICGRRCREVDDILDNPFLAENCYAVKDDEWKLLRWAHLGDPLAVKDSGDTDVPEKHSSPSNRASPSGPLSSPKAGFGKRRGREGEGGEIGGGGGGLRRRVSSPSASPTSGVDIPEEEKPLGERRYVPRNFYLETPRGKWNLTEAKRVLCELQRLNPQFHIDGQCNAWMLKPAAKSRGRGVIMKRDLSEILKTAKTEGGQWVVQKYIERPLLIEGYKFDIRQWVLVTDWNPLTVWVWKQPYIRIAGAEYDQKLESDDKMMHLVNNTVVKNHPGFEKIDHGELCNAQGFMWFLQDFQRYIHKQQCLRGQEGHCTPWLHDPPFTCEKMGIDYEKLKRLREECQEHAEAKRDGAGEDDDIGMEQKEEGEACTMGFCASVVVEEEPLEEGNLSLVDFEKVKEDSADELLTEPLLVETFLRGDTKLSEATETTGVPQEGGSEPMTRQVTEEKGEWEEARELVNPESVINLLRDARTKTQEIESESQLMLKREKALKVLLEANQKGEKGACPRPLTSNLSVIRVTNCAPEGQKHSDGSSSSPQETDEMREPPRTSESILRRKASVLSRREAREESPKSSGIKTEGHFRVADRASIDEEKDNLIKSLANSERTSKSSAPSQALEKVGCSLDVYNPTERNEKKKLEELALELSRRESTESYEAAHHVEKAEEHKQQECQDIGGIKTDEEELEVPPPIQPCENVWESQLRPQIKAAILQSLWSVVDSVEHRKGSVELFGYDFMVSDDNKVWLIEVNSSPAMDYSTPVTAPLTKVVMEDTAKVLVDRPSGGPLTPTGEWELAYKAEGAVVKPFSLHEKLEIKGKKLTGRVALRHSKKGRKKREA